MEVALLADSANVIQAWATVAGVVLSMGVATTAVIIFFSRHNRALHKKVNALAKIDGKIKTKIGLIAQQLREHEAFSPAARELFRTVYEDYLLRTPPDSEGR